MPPPDETDIARARRFADMYSTGARAFTEAVRQAGRSMFGLAQAVERFGQANRARINPEPNPVIEEAVASSPAAAFLRGPTAQDVLNSMSANIVAEVDRASPTVADATTVVLMYRQTVQPSLDTELSRVRERVATARGPFDGRVFSIGATVGPVVAAAERMTTVNGREASPFRVDVADVVEAGRRIGESPTGRLEGRRGLDGSVRFVPMNAVHDSVEYVYRDPRRGMYSEEMARIHFAEAERRMMAEMLASWDSPADARPETIKTSVRFVVYTSADHYISANHPDGRSGLQMQRLLIMELDPRLNEIAVQRLSQVQAVAFDIRVTHSHAEGESGVRDTLLKYCVHFAKLGLPCEVTLKSKGIENEPLQSFANNLQGLRPISPRVITGAKPKTATARLSSTGRRRTLLMLQSNRSKRNAFD